MVAAAKCANVQRSLEPMDTLNDCVEVIQQSLHEAKLTAKEVGAIVVGNMLAPQLQKQQQIASLIASKAGITGVPISVDSACGSGGAALHVGHAFVKSGVHTNVLVVGYEHMRAETTAEVSLALAGASDWESEGSQGETFVTLNGLLMESYCNEYGLAPNDLSHLPLNAHTNAQTNPRALYRKGCSVGSYLKSPQIHPYLKLMDASAICNGSAALILSGDSSRRASSHVQITGSSGANDQIKLSERSRLLSLDAAKRSTMACLANSGLKHSDVDFFECHDAYSVMAAVSLEASGFISPGGTASAASAGDFGLNGRLPICTHGGLKARGHPVGASGVYQAVEAVAQLQQTAPAMNQVRGANCGMVQSIGGAGTSVYTHMFQ
jgi:acetyl-CoA C-acetyltransferase